MAKQAISLVPEILDLTLYAGDGAAFRLLVSTPADVPVNLTGSMIAQVRLNRVSPGVILADFDVDLTLATDGIVVLSLTGEQTAELAPGTPFSGVWDVEWTPTDEEPITIMQGKVECVPDVSR